MFKRKEFIYSAVIIIATLLTVTSLIFNNKKDVANVSINNVVLAEQTEMIYKKDTDTKIEDTEVKINTYTVKSGDSLKSIASIYNVKVTTIAESNNLLIDTTLKEGQILEFPSIDGVLYKIKNGETLWDLALLNKVDIDKIVEVNKLDSPEKLKLGQKIIMPNVDKVKPIVTTKTISRGGSIPILSGSIPVNGRISSTFGPRWGKQHKGIDIAAPTGTDVFAFMDGKVTFSGWNAGGYGNLVIIDHGNGLQSYYAHNSKLFIKKGETISKGTHIADVGNTGNSTGPHSHFEVRTNGTPVNPYNYID